MLAQINEAWEQAKEQLSKLRVEVQRSADMAQLNLKSKYLARDYDKALRDFGEAVWGHMRKGKLQLPPALTSTVKMMLEMEKKKAAQATEISDLLKEGDEVAEKQLKAVAAKTKKR